MAASTLTLALTLLIGQIMAMQITGYVVEDGATDAGTAAAIVSQSSR